MKSISLTHGPLLFALTSSSLFAGELLFPNADFEMGNLTNWMAEGSAFTRQPTEGDNSAARDNLPSLHQGDYWIGTYENYDGQVGSPGETRGDEATGTLTSQEFTISKRYLTFLVGGGNRPGEACVKLLCEGKEYEMATGKNAESLFPNSFEVADLQGKKARIMISDQATGGWGHLNVDQFEASDEPAQLGDGQFRLLPGIPATDDKEIGYEQPLRPQFHFSARQNWLNDPNGMVYDGTKYHLFFQHNPLATEWGNMTWGHATSPDMVHWTQRDHALLPYQVDGRTGTIFSGTVVVDHNNSLGLQEGEQPTLAAFYTYASEPFYQALAYSLDGGVTWEYHNQGRAVVDNQGLDDGERDPKVFWHEESQKWVMALWVELNPGRIRFFTSENLTDWTFASDLMRDWAFECVDLFPLPIDGEEENQKWVIYDASFDYEIGSFDGTTFHTELGPFKAGEGEFYAAQTFNQAPEGRVVQVGWMREGPNSAKVYGLPYNQQMSFPCDLTLQTAPDGVRLFVWPIPEIESLVTAIQKVSAQALTPEGNALAQMGELDLVDLSIEFEPREAQEVVLALPRTTVRYHVEKKTLTLTGVDGDEKKLVAGEVAARDGRVKLRLLLDRLTLEAYVFGGEKFGSHYLNPDNGAVAPSLHSVGDEAWLHHLTVKSLSSSWSEMKAEPIGSAE